MLRTKPLIIIVVAVLLVSCMEAVTSTKIPLPRETQTPSVPQAFSTATLAASVTTTAPVTPSAMPAVTDTPTSPPETRWKTHCLDIAASLPPDLVADGMIVLNQRGAQGISRALLLNMKTGITTPLAKENEYLVGLAVSPDRKWLAYGREPINNVKSSGAIYFQNRYGVMTADGSQQEEFVLPQNSRSLSHWLDNQHLVLTQREGEVKPWTLIILNPFTGEEQKLPPDFPDIYDGPYLFPMPEWENYIGVTTYDATLTRAVYPRIEGKGVTGYVLWDLQAGQALAFLPSPYINQTPKWSPDNSQFLVVAYLAPRDSPAGKPEIFSISRDGVIKQLTDFSTNHEVFDITNYSWSPDGQYVAFEYDTLEPADRRLAILDMTTLEVTDYCIQGDLGGPPTAMFDLLPSRFTTAVPPPIWSPDSRHLIVENRYAENASRVILVDITKGVAAQIAEDMMPVGWMKSNP